MPSYSSPQANIPERRGSYQLLRDSLMTQKNVIVLPPSIIEAASGAKEVLSKRDKMAFRTIQNCSTVPCKFLVDNVNDCSAGNFHGILAACSTTDDGLGSIQSFGITGDRVTVFSTGAIRIAVFEGMSPEGVMSV